MARKNLIRSNVFPYHVTGRTNNRELFIAPLPLVYEVMNQELLLLTITYKIEIQAFVLMPNHFHLIVTIPEQDLGIIMSLFLAAVTKILNYRTGRLGHVFGGPYFWSIITSTRYYGHVYKYVYRNPVKANLCDNVESYKFSTVSGLIGSSHLAFPLSFTRLGMEINLPEHEDLERWLPWLNQPFATEAEVLIQKLLRRRQIREMIDRKTRRPVDILNRLL